MEQRNNPGLGDERLPARLLLLTPQQRVQNNTINRVDLVPCAGKITVRLTLRPSNALDLYLVMFVDEIQGPVTGEKRGHNLTILDQLRPDTLAHRTVRLTTLHANLLQNNRPALGSSFQRVRLIVEPKHAPLERRGSPKGGLSPPFKPSPPQKTPFS